MKRNKAIDTIISKIKADAEKRLMELEQSLYRRVNMSPNGDYDDWHRLVQEIYGWDKDLQSKILRNVAFHYDADTLEFWENFDSFISNCFFDDAFTAICRDKFNNAVLAWGKDWRDKPTTPDKIRELAKIYKDEMEASKRMHDDNLSDETMGNYLAKSRALKKYASKIPRCEPMDKDLKRQIKEMKAFRVGFKKKYQKGKTK